MDCDFHIRSVNGFWLFVKPGIMCVFRSASGMHVQSYPDRCASHNNHGDNTRRRPERRRIPVGEPKIHLPVVLVRRPLCLSRRGTQVH